MRRVLELVVASFCLGLIACTDPGEKTAVGAATGGVLGAGLGAIVGNQTGDPGQGLVIGALAGAGTGAMVGNALEAQEKTMQTQDEAIERQEKTIRAQSAEIDELRRMNQDTPTSAYQGAYRGQGSTRESLAYPRGGAQGTTHREIERVTSKDLSAPQSYGSAAAPGAATAPLALSDRSSPDCREAFGEIDRAAQVSEPSERLFHYRRALRMCPNQPEIYNGLGEVYLSLDRKADAEFEFKEALKLDSSYAKARTNLATIKN
ncbi:MAG: hypothetical protein DCC75_09140 [Proteobacteria bacterium]|nr:MAG: hypothetical protein DCC75_09140 [Pseudomonadota bacterium]